MSRLPMLHCADCRESFEAENDLQRHISAEHLLWLPYQCTYCRRLFKATEADARAHVRRYHGGKRFHLLRHADEQRQADLLSLMRRSVQRDADDELALISPELGLATPPPTIEWPNEKCATTADGAVAEIDLTSPSRSPDLVVLDTDVAAPPARVLPPPCTHAFATVLPARPAAVAPPPKATEPLPSVILSTVRKAEASSSTAATSGGRLPTTTSRKRSQAVVENGPAPLKRRRSSEQPSMVAPTAPTTNVPPIKAANLAADAAATANGTGGAAVSPTVRGDGVSVARSRRNANLSSDVVKPTNPAASRIRSFFQYLCRGCLADSSDFALPKEAFDGIAPRVAIVPKTELAQPMPPPTKATTERRIARRKVVAATKDSRMGGAVGQKSRILQTIDNVIAKAEQQTRTSANLPGSQTKPTKSTQRKTVDQGTAEQLRMIRAVFDLSISLVAKCTQSEFSLDL